MALRIIYQESSERGMFDYEKRFYGYLQKLIDDLDKKIKSGKERLAMTPMSNVGA
jgi:DNA replication initiation complex subunit (GINS family)